MDKITGTVQKKCCGQRVQSPACERPHDKIKLGEFQELYGGSYRQEKGHEVILEKQAREGLSHLASS